MTELLEIDYLNDEPLRQRLALWSGAILAAGVACGVVLCWTGMLPSADETGMLRGAGLLAWLLALVVANVAVLPVHELVHAALFRLMGGPGTRVTFGHAAGMLYAGCPGLVLTRARFCVVFLGPAVVLSAALLATSALLGLPLLGYVTFVTHLSSCAGDLLGCWLALRESRCTHCEDTSAGVRLLGCGDRG